jgi:hypothetical protein
MSLMISREVSHVIAMEPEGHVPRRDRCLGNVNAWQARAGAAAAHHVPSAGSLPK